MNHTETQSPRQQKTEAAVGWTVRVLGLRRFEPSHGALLAHADAELSAASETLRVYGLAILENESGSLWVGWPQRKGEKKYFPLVTGSKGLQELVQQAVLAKFEAERTGNGRDEL